MKTETVQKPNPKPTIYVDFQAMLKNKENKTKCRGVAVMSS